MHAYTLLPAISHDSNGVTVKIKCCGIVAKVQSVMTRIHLAHLYGSYLLGTKVSHLGLHNDEALSS